ncbi:3-oxoacyl-ACP synthase III family protein [Streptomyces sp. TBY4]|uniref:3-oxoacyl-ACP synthase III family protein n=1 Tax=Streptomyces sp. TBY4 TaxID=2962030 RepID=UPI0020B7B7D5|nr:beta-ketoacyl-ACP synthase 3 [Streptomyces sp. TBY4]MCP3755175.1 beta-ketoacyl-ACP synthase 3 [Streptomyces sp. TBY4]
MITTGRRFEEGPSAPAVGILGTGSCLPSYVVTNDEVGAPAGVDDAWIFGKTGIRNRRWAKPDEATSDLAIAAGRAALEAAGIRGSELSLIITATSTPDSPQPATAALVAEGLGAGSGTPAFDLNAVCSGFNFALTTAERIIRGTGGYALVVGADIYSRILDPRDRRTTILFGDGAGAVVLGPSRGRTVISARLAGFSDDHELIRVPAGGSRLPATEDTLRDGLHYFTMNGRAVRDFVADNVAPAISAFLADNGVAPADIAHFVPHQANGRMIDDLADRIGIPRDRTRSTYEEYGNTGSASVPVTLDHAVRTADMKDGDLVLLAAFGGGMAMGLVLLQW